MEPVEPNIEIVFIIVCPLCLLKHTRAHKQIDPRSDKQGGIESVQHSAVGQENMAVILHARLPLDEGHGEIAQLADSSASP